MSQLVLTGVGPLTDNYAVTNEPPRKRADDEVLVEMEAATINPADFLYAQGWYAIPPKVGATLGSEGVGTVTEGPADLVGNRVIVLPTLEQGTWATHVVTTTKNVIPTPTEGDATQLAQLAINPATAYLLLTRYGNLKAGDWIAQTLGNSAVGQYITQLAKLSGYHTLSVVRTEQAAEQVLAQGGDLTVQAGPNLADRVAEALGGKELALVLDGEGGNTANDLAQSLRFGGTVAAYSSITSEPQVLDLTNLIFREQHLTGFWLVNWLRTAPREEQEATYKTLAKLTAEGKLTSTVEATYELEDHAEALAHATTQHRTGKILFTFNKKN